MSAYDLVKIAKEKKNISSDYKLAELLNVHRMNVANWKKGNIPDGVTTLKLAEMAEVTPKEAIKLLEGGFVNLSLLFVTSSTLLAAWMLESSGLFCILCKINDVHRLFVL